LHDIHFSRLAEIQYVRQEDVVPVDEDKTERGVIVRRRIPMHKDIVDQTLLRHNTNYAAKHKGNREQKDCRICTKLQQAQRST